jgi:dihydropteroate synthase
MAEVAARHGAEIVLMHNRAASGAITYDAIAGGQYDASEDYEDVVEDVARDLAERIKVALSAKIARDKIIIDPGIGFGKTPHQNVELIAHMYHFKQLGFRVLMGPSRKSFIGKLLDLPVGERVEGTAACVTACVLQGADIVRVHDVKFMTRVVRMATLLRDA